MTRPNKLECLYVAITSQSNLTFAGNTRSLPMKEASERRYNWVDSGLASNSKTWLEWVFKDKPSSLLGLIISDEGKKFYNIDTWSLCWELSCTMLFCWMPHCSVSLGWMSLCRGSWRPVGRCLMWTFTSFLFAKLTAGGKRRRPHSDLSLYFNHSTHRYKH